MVQLSRAPVASLGRDRPTRTLSRWQISELAVSICSEQLMVILQMSLLPVLTGEHSPQVLPLWGGGVFDNYFNTKHPEITFHPPSGTRRIQLLTLITGDAMI